MARKGNRLPKFAAASLAQRQPGNLWGELSILGNMLSGAFARCSINVRETSRAGSFSKFDETFRSSPKSISMSVARRTGQTRGASAVKRRIGIDDQDFKVALDKVALDALARSVAAAAGAAHIRAALRRPSAHRV